MKIPLLGFGTWQLVGRECYEAVSIALEVGFRHIDTADRYGNHKAVAKAIEESGVAREDLYLTTKVWHSDLHKQDILKAAERFLEELQTDYLDLLLIHWPNRETPIEESMEALNTLKKKGTIKNLGVSNFTIPHLEAALKTGVEIYNNQVEFHPSFSQPELKKFCDDNGIILTAYSPIGQGEDVKLPLIQKLAEKYNRTPNQIILNWIISKGIVAIPRSTNPDRIKDSFRSDTFEMDAEDLAAIDQLNTSSRMANPPFAEFD